MHGHDIKNTYVRVPGGKATPALFPVMFRSSEHPDEDAEMLWVVF